ncbi:MAG: polysaccharide biosynthesis protein [Acidobacteriota bacterium]
MTPFTTAELETLLERPIRRLLTADDRRAFAGRRVLVTGGGGSVGSELARQIAACRPERLTLLDNSELNLFQIERELHEQYPALLIEPVLADVAQGALVRQAVQLARPHIVYHAAAYKHVTMVERAVCASVAVNVFGTMNVAVAARAVGARFVLISSDKAAAPTSVMGATKRVAEIVVRHETGATFRPIVVRFGNVLGSSGSVLTIMRERIRQGLPVPITDPNATRYFMTAGEAVSLVMKTDLLARAAETYWLDMGEPVLIGELTERLLALEARAGYPRVPITVVGLRPGEKLREELAEQGLKVCRTAHPRIWVTRQRGSHRAKVTHALGRLGRAVTACDATATLDVMSELAPEYRVSPEARALARAQSVQSHGPLYAGEARTA